MLKTPNPIPFQAVSDSIATVNSQAITATCMIYAGNIPGGLLALSNVLDAVVNAISILTPFGDTNDL